MKYSKILLTALSFALIQSCSDDENIIETNPDNATLQASYDAARLKIVSIEPTVSGFENATYTWKLGNEIIGNEKTLGFVSDKVGAYDLMLEIKSGTSTKTVKTKVNVTQETATYSKYISQVFDYLPAVGQFTNKLPAYVDGDTQTEMTAKAGKALVGEKSTMITLGGYGGYVVFGFDHTILNQKDKRDFKVLGNGFAGSSEPGIIMVAYDKNKNGKPDEDEWYEIAGSEYTNPTTIKNYTITYHKPTVEDSNATPEYIKWEDNQGKSGFKAKNTFHKQPYYPIWFGQNQLKFSGTLLESNYTEKNGIWTGKQLAYGYVDNAPNNSEDSNIDIDWAVDKNGNPVKLMGIDFIKVYTATNQEAGWLGEISTEVAGAYDLHL
ncbi:MULTISPECIES: PKD-like domain-containing protein [Empedobacter]|uniref:PKD-like domain-containing protein n=2 Tax=Weeksellaceae TaxID=2762318 RepID=UPI00056ED23C|nr:MULTISPECIES: PKD-like domain-containing protein [Empedobacter]MDM1137872.1 cell surface protein [Empedobacter sp. R132-2]HAD78379.1 cell surface protein [Flavobacteriaceae bacterium]HBX62312.1 cell surface protein [Flavobacteriaceae bacterium]